MSLSRVRVYLPTTSLPGLATTLFELRGISLFEPILHSLQSPGQEEQLIFLTVRRHSMSGIRFHGFSFVSRSEIC